MTDHPEQIESVRHAVAENDWPWSPTGSVIVGRCLLAALTAKDEEIARLRAVVKGRAR